MEWNYAESGGLGYHLAAIRYSRGTWASFRRVLGQEITRRLRRMPESETRSLVLVGPSGGYCLDPEVLRREGPVFAIDVDPLSRPIFLWRHRRRRAQVEWKREDFFESLEASGFDPVRWWESRDAAPSSGRPIFLFMNLLGQLEFIYPETRLREIEAGLLLFFSRMKASVRDERGFDWISVHDRIAFPTRHLDSTLEDSVVFSDHRLSDEELAEKYGSAREIETHRIGEWIRHAGGECAYLPWRLTHKSVLISEVASSGF